ncbi:MAG: class I SAM-dependent methyltransferase [Patescibacteria group bacterium]
MTIADKWNEYEILDCGEGQKLERWGKEGEKLVLSRPDPQAIWPKEKPELWNTADAVYIRNAGGGGKWTFPTGKTIPEKWIISYQNLKFWIRPTEFKHTGIFPEQGPNWDWLINKIKEENQRELNILNLFAYTGAATLACAFAGAKVCHIDASKGIVEWAKENLVVNNLTEKPVRFIVDDVLKFVEREKRRGMKYDGIIMDPPSFGRGSKGETWKIEKDLWPLVKSCVGIMSDNPVFFIINSYTSGLPSQVMVNILDSAFEKIGGSISAEELSLPIKNSNKLLPAGSTVRWEK